MGRSRVDVYKAIDSERDFQEANKKINESHIVDEFPLGSALSAIQHKLEVARSTWYNTLEPHEDAMEEIRKIAAICVQMGEKYEMSKRK
jgi:hypothetical protein